MSEPSSKEVPTVSLEEYALSAPKRIRVDAPKFYPEIPLRTEFERQVESIVDLAARLNISRNRCLGL